MFMAGAAVLSFLPSRNPTLPFPPSPCMNLVIFWYTGPSPSLMAAVLSFLPFTPTRPFPPPPSLNLVIFVHRSFSLPQFCV